MDLRTQTSLIAAVLSLAIAGTVVLRTRRRKVHWLFGMFAASIALWYLTTFLGRLVGGGLLERVNLVCATLLPLAGVQFFRAFIGEDSRRMIYLNRGALAAAVVVVALTLTPLYSHIALKTTLFSYVLVILVAVLAIVFWRGRTATSRFEGARLRYLALAGALAATFTLVDYLPYVGLDIPPVGTVLTLVFLYALSQSVLQFRLLDLYELAGRLAVLTAVSFGLAVIFWVLVELAGGRFFLHAVVAALVVLLLVDPIRSKVEDKISQVFFRERYDLEHTIVDLRRRVAHALERDVLTRVLVEGLERTRRVTHASVYLLDDEMAGYDLEAHVGPEPAMRVEIAPARPLLDRLEHQGAIVYETVERELEELREVGEDREAETHFEVLQSLDALAASVCAPISAQDDSLYGFLCVRDERLRDAFSPEEVQLLRGLAAQAAISLENSRLYQRMKDRDRLAALGEMAAGLAHEIRNPLGAIKAAAQFLEEPPSGEGEEVTSQGEFLDIIVEEVDRLNRVVSSFLDYARPAAGDARPTDVNSALHRTMQLLAAECQAADVAWSLSPAPEPPLVSIDVEQLRQVLINLVMNAVQAMESGGELLIETSHAMREDVFGVARPWVEIRVSDTGPGIPKAILHNLFVPFVTTKDRGTGLGLAVSQRIVAAAGGHIDVRTDAGVGATFVVHLPAAGGSGQSEEPADPSASSAAGGASEPAPSSPPEDSPSGDSDSGAGDRAKVLATSR